jgi:hypothetical protein
MTNERAIETYRLPDRSLVQETLKGISEFQRLVHSSLKEGHDYGVIPGTKKPTLFKPGAEKITSLCGVAPKYEIIDSSTDWTKGLFEYVIRCSLVSVATGDLIDSGIGECNSFESKYRYRWLWDNELSEYGIDRNEPGHRTRTTKSGKTQWRIENEDPADLRNTILKMAKKRALVDAALSIGSLSELFTQDIEDLQRDAARLTVDDDNAERDESTPFCDKHGVSFRKFEKDNSTWYSHPDGEEWCNYKKPAKQASTPASRTASDPLKADKATWEPFMVRVKGQRGDSAQEDLAHIIEGGSSPKVLRAYALKRGVKTPDELFDLCVEQWAQREDNPWDEPLNDPDPEGNEDDDPAKEISDPSDGERLATMPEDTDADKDAQ